MTARVVYHRLIFTIVLKKDLKNFTAHSCTVFIKKTYAENFRFLREREKKIPQKTIRYFKMSSQ